MSYLQDKDDYIIWDGGKIILRTYFPPGTVQSEDALKSVTTQLSTAEVKPTIKRLIQTYLNPSLGFGKDKHLAMQVLRETVKALDQVGIPYFLISGTLLGHVRHGDCLPWDDDIDLMVHSSVIDKLKEVMSKAPSLHYFVYKGMLKFALHGTQWPFVDIFTYTESGNKIKFFNQEWNSKLFFPTKKVTFMETEVSIPCIPEYFLRENYGNQYMNYIQSGTWNHRKEVRIPSSIYISTQLYKDIVLEGNIF